MAQGRHKQRSPQRFRRLVAIVAPAVMVAAIPVGVVTVWPDDAGEESAAADSAPTPDVSERRQAASRGGEREPVIDPDMVSQTPFPAPTVTPEETPTEEPDPTPSEEEEEPEEEEVEVDDADEATPAATPDPEVIGEQYATVALNVRTAPRDDAEVKTVLDVGSAVRITDVTEGSWVQVVHDDEPGWVSGNYLSDTEPEPAEESSGSNDSGGISTAECASGSEVESGLTPDGIRVHRALCAQFPDISSYGGVRPGSGEHSQGRAVDAMVSNSALGDSIAEWVRANHRELGVSEVIWAQRIWTVQRSSEGWRPMEDRGSDTANHYDHVHVTVYGDSGSV